MIIHFNFFYIVGGWPAPRYQRLLGDLRQEEGGRVHLGPHQVVLNKLLVFYLELVADLGFQGGGDSRTGEALAPPPPPPLRYRTVFKNDIVDRC